MNKLIYCFRLKDLTIPPGDNVDLSTKEAGNVAINSFYQSALLAKKLGFKIEVLTDMESSKHLEQFAIWQINPCLEFISSYENSPIETKMFAFSLQTEPFVYMDWNISIKDKVFVKRIRSCKKDLIVASRYNILPDTNYQNNTQVVYSDLNNSAWLMTMSEHFIEEFVNKRQYAYDCRIIGFNNLNFKDAYVIDFLKCLNVMRGQINSHLVIEEYLLFCIAKSKNVSVQTLYPFNDKKLSDLFLSGNDKLTIPEVCSKKTPNVTSGFFQKKYVYNTCLTNQPSKKKQPTSISLCIVVMNRKEHLLKTLEPNLTTAEKFNGLVDINIINYNSKDGLEEELFAQEWFTGALKRGVIKYYRNYDATKYHATLPKNIIHFLSDGDYLINVDADNFIGESYLSYCFAKLGDSGNIFFRPSGYSANGAYGRIGVHRGDFSKIGGYNLKMENWGFEDTEITLRLKKIGLRQILIPSHLCLDVIDHDNKTRKLSRNYGHFKDELRNSEFENVSRDFELYPNLGVKMNVEVFRVNHIKEKVRINEPSTYFSNL